MLNDCLASCFLGWWLWNQSYSDMQCAGCRVYPVPLKFIVTRTLPSSKQYHIFKFICGIFWSCAMTSQDMQSIWAQISKVDLTLRATNYPLQSCVTSHTLDISLFYTYPTYMKLCLFWNVRPLLNLTQIYTLCHNSHAWCLSLGFLNTPSHSV